MKLSYREKIGLLVVIVLAVVIIFIAWPIKLLRNNIDAHTAERDRIKVDYDQTKSWIAEIPTIESNINAIYENSKGLSEGFVAHMENIDFDKYFEQLLNKEPYKKNGKNALELIDGLAISGATTGEIPFYYYTPNVITYPILVAADTNGDLMETTDKVLYEKVNNAVEMSTYEGQEVEVRTATLSLRFTKEALLALEDELKKETGIRIKSVEIGDYTFANASQIPDAKGYSEGNVVIQFYTMQQIQKPDFSK